MLDVIRQLMPALAAAEKAPPPPAQAHKDRPAFGHELGRADGPKPARGPRAADSRGKDDRPELSGGWETAEASAYEDPSAQAAAGAAGGPPAQDASAPSQPSSAQQDADNAEASAGTLRPAGEAESSPAAAAQAADQAGQPAPASALLAQQAQALLADQAAARPEAPAPAQTPAPAAQAQAAPQVAPANTRDIPTTAAYAAAPEYGGGTPSPIGMEAGGAAVLSTQSAPTSDCGQPINDDSAPAPRAPRAEGAGARAVASSAGTPKAGGQDHQAGPGNRPAPEPAQPPAPPPATLQGGAASAWPAQPAPERTEAESANIRATDTSLGRASEPPPPATALQPPAAGSPLADLLRMSADARPSTAAPSAGTDSPPAADLPAPDAAHLAERVVRWQHLGLLDGHAGARIRLQPPELGSVQVALRTLDNAVTVQLAVEGESVRQLLLRHTDRLAEGLQSQGLHAASIEVVLQDSQTREGLSRDGSPERQGADGQPTGQGQRQSGGEPFPRPWLPDLEADAARDELNLTA